MYMFAQNFQYLNPSSSLPCSSLFKKKFRDAYEFSKEKSAGEKGENNHFLVNRTKKNNFLHSFIVIHTMTTKKICKFIKTPNKKTIIVIMIKYLSLLNIKTTNAGLGSK